MQALGAYGFRGFYERKPHFLQSVPYALKNLRWLQQHVELPIAVPALLATFEDMAASEKLQSLASASATEVGDVAEAKPRAVAGRTPPVRPAATKVLTLRIFSFSFHQGGLPQDESGHGGGFVFDLRSLPNPGREDRFKSLSGKDAPVIEYLQGQERAQQFLANVLALVEASVQDYQRRGFGDLMVSFGCTGGQHRSVYMAERLAEQLRARAGGEVIVRHMELEKLESRRSAGKLGQ
jgi:RNase adaptor protein for sRNA GlmZ degradation